MTQRDFGPPTVTPRAHFDALLEKERLAHIQRGLEPETVYNSGVAFLFGSERFGMTNEDVYRCHVCLSIPSNPQFGSLNLAAALQVIAYDWREALAAYPVTQATAAPMLADAAQVTGMLAHLEQALVAIDFLDPQAPKKLMPRLNQLFNRAGVTQEEVHILRGMAKAMLKLAAKPVPSSMLPESN
jgi:tRNA/rRNA methyltransferase